MTRQTGLRLLQASAVLAKSKRDNMVNLKDTLVISYQLANSYRSSLMSFYE